jgi:hypothetical protein
VCIADIVSSLSTLVNEVMFKRRQTVITCHARHVRSNAVANDASSTLSLLYKVSDHINGSSYRNGFTDQQTGPHRTCNRYHTSGPSTGECANEVDVQSWNKERPRRRGHEVKETVNLVRIHSRTR